MLQTLSIRRYRGFESYRLADLARVNLVVGKNNCGKTSVLEAVELLVAGGHPSVFLTSLERRSGVEPGGQVSPDASHVFFGHRCAPGASFNLSSDDSESTVSAKILSRKEVGDEFVDRYVDLKRRRERYFGHPVEDPMPRFGLSIGRDTSGNFPEEKIVLPVMENGRIPIRRYDWTHDRPTGPPVHFYSVDSLNPASMGGMWNTVLAKGLEADVVNDMRLLEPEIDSIHFLTGTEWRSEILIGLRNGGGRLPIGSYGDGMRRLLAMRLSFVGAVNGFLLVDEIDTGLHWTIMEDMWQFVVEVARRLNVQIFATTHSYDCIRGLGSLLQSRPEMEDEISIQKIHGSLKQAACLRGDQIRVAVEQEIEVR